ncbi:MAG: HEAT repeat domain-containing protein [Leptospiraceae bacterium]|nr:HEAT repeat domain-containing protein [Leptospiraceae bacterium]
MNLIVKFKNWRKLTKNSVITFLTSVILISNLFFIAEISADNSSVVSTNEDSNSSEDPERIGDVEPSAGENPTSKKSKKPKKGLTEEQIAKKKEVLTKILKFGSHKERKEAMREVTRFPKEHSEELYKLIAEILTNDSDIGIKITSLRTLAEVNYRGDLPAIINSLKHKSDDVKEATVFAIQKMKVEESADELLNFLKGQDFTKNQTITSNAIASLSDLENGKVGSEFLEAKFREKTTHTNNRAAIALYFGKIKDIRAENALIDATTDENEDPMTRAYAINSLGKMNSRKAVPSIREVLEKINETRNKFDAKRLSNLKIYCIGALIALGDTEVMKDLMTYAKDDDPNVRLRAIKQLAEIGSKDAIELIEYKSQRDPSRKVQITAKKLLEDLKKKEIEENPANKNQMRPITPAVP